MNAQAEKHYPSNQGIRLVREMLDRGQNIFTSQELKPVARELQISPSYLHSQLLPMLQRSGWIIRLRRGLYASTGEVTGTSTIHPFAIATHLVQPSAISHWSALSYHGMTEQVPQIVTAFTTKKVVTPSMRTGKADMRGRKPTWQIDGNKYEYFTVIPDHFFGITDTWVDQTFRVPITDPERTLLESFVSYKIFGGMGEVLDLVEQNHGRLDLKKFVDYARRYGKASVAKRVGWVLEQHGVSEQILEPLLKLPVSSYRRLDPSRPYVGECNSRWMIQDNISAGKK